MKNILCIFIYFLFCNDCIYSQLFKYDSNHQVTEIKYDNGTIVSIQYDANGNRVNYTTSAGGALPVTLLSFDAKKSGERVLLIWTTTQEINTDKFEIEYSKDGVVFSSFTSIAANGNSTVRRDYSTLHCCPVEGINFYRLKMIDKDGSFKYSETRRVMFEFAAEMKLYPNPSSENAVLNISFTKPFVKDASISIYGANGALIYNSLLSKGETLMQVKTDGFSAGSYFVIVSVGGVQFREKYIKQ